MRTEETSAGLELKIYDLQFEDAGTYRCSATNKDGSAAVTQDIQLTVECMFEKHN